MSLTNSYYSEMSFQFVADLHIHTLASGHAYSSIEEIATAAVHRGLQMIAITDHGPALAGGPSPYYFMNQNIWPRQLKGVSLLRGAEANIMPDGHIDLQERASANLDFILAGFHYDAYPPGQSRNEYTRALLSVMDDPRVLAISHPGNPAYPIDYEQFVKKAVERDILIEVNESSLSSSMRPGSLENCRTIVRLGKEMGATFIANSDAHMAHLVGHMEQGAILLAQEGIPSCQIINTSIQKIVDFLVSHGNAGITTSLENTT